MRRKKKHLKKSKSKICYVTYSDEISTCAVDKSNEYIGIDRKRISILIDTMAGYNEPVIFCGRN
nr:MAG TPA: hypothetical protein [Caudoviricetes sp.]